MQRILQFMCWLFFTSLVMTSVHAELGAASLTQSHSAWVKSSSALTSPKPFVYSIQKIITQDEIEVHEYLNATGLVFGLAWAGESKPNMSSMLGSFAGRYQFALSQPSSARAPVAINTPDFVVQTGGRMNHFFGVAFLPTLAPQGVSLEDIK